MGTPGLRDTLLVRCEEILSRMDLVSFDGYGADLQVMQQEYEQIKAELRAQVELIRDGA